jgi:hypothetical protein
MNRSGNSGIVPRHLHFFRWGDFNRFVAHAEIKKRANRTGFSMWYWINTVSYTHVKAGMEGGYTQANHGQATNMQRLSKGDLIARVLGEESYQVEMTSTFHP